MKPSEILSKIKKYQWTRGKYWTMSSDYTYDKYCFNGFIINEILGYPEPMHGTEDLFKVYGSGYQLIHDMITDINDNDKQVTFTDKKSLAIEFLKREGL